MAAGDAHRVWFPEMIEKLRRRWHDGMSFAEMIELRDELDAMLGNIRGERGIRSAVIKCRHCGHIGEGADPHVSIRALILALARFGVVTDPIRTIESHWASYRKLNRLDLYGKPLTSPRTSLCGH